MVEFHGPLHLAGYLDGKAYRRSAVMSVPEEQCVQDAPAPCGMIS